MVKNTRENNILETRRLRLRPWTRDDLQGFHSIWGDPDVVWWRAPDPSSEASAHALDTLLSRCESMPPGRGWWCVLERETGSVVGNVMLQPMPGDTERTELGYHIVSARWGEGLATEAARAVLNYGSLVLGLEQVVAAVHGDHPASAKVAERLGFEEDGVIIRNGLLHRLFLWAPETSSDHWEPVQGTWP